MPHFHIKDKAMLENSRQVRWIIRKSNLIHLEAKFYSRLKYDNGTKSKIRKFINLQNGPFIIPCTLLLVVVIGFVIMANVLAIMDGRKLIR